MCQKLAKSVDVHWSYSVQRQCRFFETQCTATRSVLASGSYRNRDWKFYCSKCYKELANMVATRTRGCRACRTCFEDDTRMLRGSYEETALVEFSLFQAGGRTSRPNLALVFLWLFCVIVSLFWCLWWTVVFVVKF